MTRRRWIERFVVIGILLAPATWIVGRVAVGDLGADPVETLSQETGRWALRFLLATLAVTPARRWLGWNRLVVHRRSLGLAAFGYAIVHFLLFVGLDQGFDLAAIVGEIAERRWITLGFTALVLMIPLALTSTNGMVRRLGARRWRRLHRLVYLVGLAAVLHYFWAVKADTRLPIVYGLVLAVLLASRLVPRRARARGEDRSRRVARSTLEAG